MKHHLHTVKHILYILILSVLGIYIFCAVLFPEQINKIIGYRFYAIVTGSMEPTIPTYSLVLTKNLSENEEPEIGSIITFHANRFGEDIILTHYLKDIVVGDNGEKRYMTQAEGVNNYDDYITTRNDVKGITLFHIPYAGKLLLYIQSPYGIVNMFICFLLFLINNHFSHKFEEDDELQGAEILIDELQLIKHQNYFNLHGIVKNRTPFALHHVTIIIQCLNRDSELIYEMHSFIIRHHKLRVKQQSAWSCNIPRNDDIDTYHVQIASYKKSL